MFKFLKNQEKTSFEFLYFFLKILKLKRKVLLNNTLAYPIILKKKIFPKIQMFCLFLLQIYSNPRELPSKRLL